jgi:hypothetical protein
MSCNPTTTADRQLANELDRIHPQLLPVDWTFEKDLPVEKGGTLGFDAERENAEIEARWEELEKKEMEGKSENGKKGDDNMDESK